MGTESEHRKKAEHNGKFLATIDVREFPDWAAIVAFYKSVHLVELLLARTHNLHSKGHGDRNRSVKRHHPDIWAEYRPIFNVSLIARYKNGGISSRQIESDILRRRLPSLEALVLSKTAPPAGGGPAGKKAHAPAPPIGPSKNPP